jgi:predicted oxidoreductase (fatty acid repression mutant protein)
MKPKDKNDCVGEDQQHFNRPIEEHTASTFEIPSQPVLYSFLIFLMK